MLTEITIRPTLNGYIIGVGCQSLVYTSKGDLIQDITDWIMAPEETEKRIRSKCYHIKLLLSATAYEERPLRNVLSRGVEQIDPQ